MSPSAAKFRWAGLLVAILALPPLPGHAQMSGEEQQRCVWSCLYNSPGAESAEYRACVARLCEAPDSQQSMPNAEPPAATRPAPTSPAATASGWTTSSMPDGSAHSAQIASGSQSLSFMCQRGGPGLLAIAGLPGPAEGITVQIDRQRYGLPFVTQNGIHYTAADPGSHLLGALLGGASVQVTNARGNRADFSLRGSAAAIRSALAACGLRG